MDDTGADAALEAMPQLETLDVRSCPTVGDGAAAAVARHAALRVVDLRGTRVGPVGVHALRRWEAKCNTKALRGERTTADTNSHWRTVCLDERHDHAL